MRMKIIILIPIPLTKTIYDNFFADYLKSNGFEVVFWDFSGMFDIGASQKHEFICEGTIKVKDKRHFNELLKKYAHDSATPVISTFSYCYQFLFIYRTLNKYNIRLHFMARGASPSFQLLQSKMKRRMILLSKVLNPVKCLNMIGSVVAIYYKKLGYTKKVDVIFQAGSEALATLGLGYHIDAAFARQIIGINYFDYDKYIKALSQSVPLLKDADYVVFLDDYLPSHPDFDLISLKKVNEETYYAELNNWFDYVEDFLKVRVVIAAHPKAVYNDNPFNGREILFDKTVELVKDCQMVLAHGSSSISYAVCFRKKIILMSSDEMKTLNLGYLHNGVLGFSKYLGLNWINISNTIDTDLNNIVVNEEKYKDYLYSYLTNVISEKRETRDILLEYLTNYSNK